MKNFENWVEALRGKWFHLTVNEYIPRQWISLATLVDDGGSMPIIHLVSIGQGHCVILSQPHTDNRWYVSVDDGKTFVSVDEVRILVDLDEYTRMKINPS